MEELIDELVKKYRWSREAFELTWHAKFCCAYCGIDILKEFEVFRFSETDHLLPKHKYRLLEKVESNHVVACHTCNSLKGRWDPNRNEDGDVLVPESAVNLTNEQRAQLIDRTKQHLERKRANVDAEFEAMRQLIRKWLAQDAAAP